MLLMFVEEARGERLCQNWGDKSEKIRISYSFQFALFLKKVNLSSSEEQRYWKSATTQMKRSIAHFLNAEQRSTQYVDFKTPLHLQSERERTGLIYTFLLCFALWGWHLKYPGFYWKQIYYSRTERTEMVITALSRARFYNYCSLLEHAVTS